MNEQHKLNIAITQIPSRITSMSPVSLESKVSYINTDRQKELLYISDILQYDWLYSTDNGKTFKQLNRTSSTLNIKLDATNINFIYKLKVSVQRPISTIVTNQSQNEHILAGTSEGDISTNQTIDDSELYYSQNIVLNHNLDLEDVILQMSLEQVISELEDSNIVLNIFDNDETLEINTDQQNIENTQQTSNVVLTGSNGVQPQGLLGGYCYEPITTYVCGADVTYCIATPYWGLYPPDSCMSATEAGCAGCILTKAGWSINQQVGTWKNSKIEDGVYRWCENISNKAGGGDPYGGDLDYVGNTDDEWAMLCPNDGSEPIYNGQVCNGVPARGKVKNPGCPGYSARWVDGFFKCSSLYPTLKIGDFTIPGVPNSTCYEWSETPNKSCSPCRGPLSLAMYPLQGSFTCNNKIWFNKKGCVCDGEEIPAGDCDTDPTCGAAPPPSLTYSGHGLSASVYVLQRNGKDTPELWVSAGGLTSLPEGDYTLSLEEGSHIAANYSVSESITVTVKGNKDTECDMYGLSMGEDPWGGCVTGGDCVVPGSIDKHYQCYNSDKYYTWGEEGAQTYACGACCEHDEPYQVNAPIVFIRPEKNRPTSSAGLLTLQECKDQIEKAYGKDPYYLITYRLSPQNQPCTIECQDQEGFWNKPITKTLEYKLGGSATLIGGGVFPGDCPINACTPCQGCQSDADCEGCDACCNGECTSFGSETGYDAGDEYPCHPCTVQAINTGGLGSASDISCCAQYDFTGNKTILCADSKKCEKCSGPLGPDGILGSKIVLTYEPNALQGCCNGKIYDTQCEVCIDGKIEDKCVYHTEPKFKYECVETGTASYVDQYGNPGTYITKECRLKPCPACQRPAPDYESTGNCVLYESTQEARSQCLQCDIDSDYPDFERITFKGLEGQVCCQTGDNSWQVAYVCCPSTGPIAPNQGYNFPCFQGQKCCPNDCYDPATECCDEYGSAKYDSGDKCFDCQSGDWKCPGEPSEGKYICCKNSNGAFKGCANIDNCEKCDDFGNVVLVDELTGSGAECKECDGSGNVVPITSSDPDDPCYSDATPQSIFYEP